MKPKGVIEKMAQTWTISDKDYVMIAQFTNEDSNFISNDEHFISVDTPSSYYQFDCLIKHDLAKYMVVGNHVILRDKEGFVHDFTIRKIATDINNVRMTVYAENGGMDLNNESAQPFTAPNEQKSLEWYLTQSGQPLFDSPIKLGLNELSDLRRVISNDSTETKLLQRLITTTNAFGGGEFRLYAKLANNDTTLPVLNLQLDIVKKLGSDISQTFLIDDYNLKELTNETSIIDLITAVFPRGKELDNGTTVDISDIVYDDGTYYTTKGSQYIKNRKAHAEWSYNRFSNDERWGYILGNFKYDTESPQELFNRALTYLKQHDSPTVAFSASGREMNAKLGDTIMIATHKTPEPIYLRARVLQMKVSYVDDNKTEYILGNFAIQPSMVSQELLNLRNQIKDNKVGYVWLRYADDREGNGISESPEGKSYMGIAYNKSNPEPSNNPSDYSWSLIKGDNGTDGVGVQTSNVQYALADSGTAHPTSGWTTTIPTLQDNKYLWTRTIIYYTNGTNTVSYSVSKKGDTGETGNGVSSTVVNYGVSTSGTTQPTSWGTSIPSVPNGQFLWTRTTMNYTDRTSTTFYSVAKMGETGARGTMGIAYLQPTAPTGNIETGSTWFKTVSATDNRITSVYHYLSGSWVQNQFTQDAINVKSLSALSATLGNVTAGTITGSIFTNTFNRSYTSTLNRTGTTTLSDGKLRIDYRNVDKSTGVISADGSYMEYSETGIDFAENDGTSTGKRLELNSNRIALGASNGAFYADPTKLQLSGNGYFESQPRYFLGSSGDTNYQKMSWTVDGFELRPVDINGNPRNGNTGIEITGSNSYIDFKTPYNGAQDYDIRIIEDPSKRFLIQSDTSQPIYIQSNVGGNVQLITNNSDGWVNSCSNNGFNSRNPNDTAFQKIQASSFVNSSDEKWKYNVKDIPSRLEQFKNIDFKAYRLWSENGKYQEGVIANDNIELPFISKGYDGYAVDTYAYTTFIGKATQEYIVQTDNAINEFKNENAEIKAENAELKNKFTNLESENAELNNKVDNLSTELETIKQQLSTLMNK